MCVRRRWVSAPIGEVLGVDPLREVTAQRIAAAAGIAPKVFEFDSVDRSMVMAYVAGHPLEEDWPLRSERRRAMAQLLERLRTIEPVGLPRLDLAERLCVLHRALMERSPHRAQRFDRSLEEVLCALGEADERQGAGVISRCLVHGDLTPANTRVLSDGSLQLVDWEYAHAGHRLEDLAGLVVLNPASAQLDDNTPGFDVQVRLRRLLDGLWYEVAALMTGNESLP